MTLPTATTVLGAIAQWGIPVLLTAMLACVVRMVRGPTKVDRVLALDIASILSVGILGLMTIVHDDPYLVDVATAAVLVTFLATVGYARFIASTARLEETRDDD